MLIFGQSSSDEHAICGNKPKKVLPHYGDFPEPEHFIAKSRNPHLWGPYYYYYYYYYYYVSCHGLFLPGTSLETAAIPTAQDSSFTLKYFPYYV